MSKKIFIDAGHGGTDPGAVHGSRYEKNDNLSFSLALINRLKDHGFDVSQSRTTDTAVSLENRVKSANNWNADLFISIHRNSFTSDSANGLETWIYTNVNQTTKNFANYIQQELVNVYAQSNRGVQSGDLYVTKATSMPAVLLELGFISNATDNAKFDEYFSQYVEAVCKGICQEFGTAYKSESQEKLYRVQTGAFREKSNAENQVKSLKNAGFDVFIVEV